MTDIEKKAYEVFPYEKGLDSINDRFFDRNWPRREGYVKCAEEYESLPKIRGWAYTFGDGLSLDFELSKMARVLKKAGFKPGDKVEMLIRKVK